MRIWKERRDVFRCALMCVLAGMAGLDYGLHLGQVTFRWWRLLYA